MTSPNPVILKAFWMPNQRRWAALTLAEIKQRSGCYLTGNHVMRLVTEGWLVSVRTHAEGKWELSKRGQAFVTLAVKAKEKQEVRA